MTPLNPTTSLCMIYLRAYAKDASTRRGMVRAGRKAMHLLRMHWSACAVDAHSGAYGCDRATKSRSEGQDSREADPSPQIAHAQGGLC